jgi:pantothenate kinase
VSVGGLPERGAPARLIDLVDYLQARLQSTGSRQILGIVGAPGTGKSTVARTLADALGRERCVVVPMDGFHLANEIFDVGGYLSILQRLRARDEPVVFAPSYRRGLEEPIAASIAVARDIDYVITEGNYLLAAEPPWDRVRSLVDEIWFVHTPPAVRLERLIDRHVAFGMDRDAAIVWATGPDEANARFIESTRHRADRQIASD